MTINHDFTKWFLEPRKQRWSSKLPVLVHQELLVPILCNSYFVGLSIGINYGLPLLVDHFEHELGIGAHNIVVQLVLQRVQHLLSLLLVCLWLLFLLLFVKYFPPVPVLLSCGLVFVLA